MSQVIYWAIKLNEEDKNKLLNVCSPIHKNIFAEHITLAFRPTSEISNKLIELIGEEIIFTVIGQSHDHRGQAVVVKLDNSLYYGDSLPHITISCSDDIRPVYSNLLIKNGWKIIPSFGLHGRIAKYTNNGWVIDKY